MTNQRRAPRSLSVPEFRIFESINEAAREVPAQPHGWAPHEWATLYLAIDGGYCLDWSRSRVQFGPATLALLPPGEFIGARTSSEGNHCLGIAVHPLALQSIGDGLSDWDRLRVPRRPPPHWLAFELRRELELGDDVSTTSVEATITMLLAELLGIPSVEARRTPLPWLEQVRERLHDEFRQSHTLESLARTAGVHRVHLAREFRRAFGCTVGHYIRQRRVEFACHRLAASRRSLSRIAFEAGFADQSHFTNTFRWLVGVPPGVFRRRFASTHRGRPAYRLPFPR